MVQLLDNSTLTLQELSFGSALQRQLPLMSAAFQQVDRVAKSPGKQYLYKLDLRYSQSIGVSTSRPAIALLIPAS